MIVIAASLYLPEHVATMLSRAWFYYAGEENAVVGTSQGQGQGKGRFGAAVEAGGRVGGERMAGVGEL